MAFPLAAIGAGLGLFAQDYLKKRQADSQLDLTRAALLKEKQQRDAESLLGGLPGSAFQTGAGDISSVGGGSMGRPPGAGGSPVGSPAPPPMQPQGGGLNLPGSRFIPPQQDAPQPEMRSPTAFGSSSPMRTVAVDTPAPAGGGPRQMGPDAQSAMEDFTQPLTPEQNVDVYRAAGAQPYDRTGVGDRHDRTAAPPEQPVPQTSGQTAPQPQTSPQPGGTTQAGGNVVPINNPIVQRLLGPTLDLGGVMDRIRAARPGADPGTVWRAATMMYEMVEKGNQQQMNNAIKALTQLRLQDQLGETARHHVASETTQNTRTGIAQQRADTGTAAQADTAQDRQVRRGQAGERIEIAKGNLAARQQQMQSAIKRADDMAKRGDRNGSRGIYATMLTSLRAQLNPPLGSTPPDDQTRAWLQQQIDDVTNRLRALDSMGTAPARPAAPAAQ